MTATNRTAGNARSRTRCIGERAAPWFALTSVVIACSWATETTCSDGVGCASVTGGTSGAGANSAAGDAGSSENAGTMSALMRTDMAINVIGPRRRAR